jgi:hypothetical protein
VIQLRTYSPALKPAALAIAALAIFLTLAIWIIYNGRANADEGFYALASKLAISGKIPYRDFAYTQMPLLPYLQGAFLHWFGFTVEAQRWLNVFWSCCLLGMIAWRLHQSGAAQLAWASTLCQWFTAIPIVYFSIIGKTYGLAQLLLVIAALGLWLKDPRRSLCHIALFGILAIGCRLTVAPAVAVIYLYPTIRILRQKTGLLWVLIPPLFFASTLLCPFFLLAPDNTYFWTWQCHILSTLPKRPIIQVFGEFTIMAPGLLLVTCYALWYGIKSTGKHSTHYLFCLGAGLFGAAVNIITTSFYAEYAVMFTPLIVLGAGGLITQESVPREPAPRQMVLLAGCALSLAFFCLSNKDRYIMPGYIESVKTAGIHLAQRTRPNALVITPMPEVLLQADRRGHRQLAMGCFSVTGDMPENQARGLGMMHINQLLRELYQGSADALVLWNGTKANFEYSTPSMCYFTKETHKLTAETIKRNYEPSFSNKYFTVLVRKTTSSVP